MARSTTFSDRPRRSLSRRGFFRLSAVLGGATVLAGVRGVAAYAEVPVAASGYPTRPMTFCVMSDLHLLSSELWADNDAYMQAENSDRKMFRESESILKKALAEVVAVKPDLVFVPGDLTKDGELACHKRVHELFEEARAQLKQAGVATSFCIINGNHDLNNHGGLNFATLDANGDATPADRTTPAAFKELWAEYGYADAIVYDPSGTADGSLSYAARPFKGLTVIAVDTCRYNEQDPDGTGVAQTTSGRVTEQLLAWVCSQARQAKAAGDLVVAVQHHGIVPHFADEPTLMSEYLVDDYEAVAQAYAQAGISAVFTGHMHANDVATATYGDATICDIETGSLVTYPSYMRTGSITYAQDGANVRADIAVEVHGLGAVAFSSCGLEGQAANDITAYGQERTFTTVSVQTMLNSLFVAPALLQMQASGGSKVALAQALAGTVGDGSVDGLNAALWEALVAQLPVSRDAGLMMTIPRKTTGIIDLPLSIWYDVKIDQINISSQPKKAPSASKTEYLTVSRLSFAAFLDALFAEVDAKAIDDPSKTLEAVAAAVALLLAGDVADGHDLLKLMDTCYQAHLLGCESASIPDDSWVNAAITALSETGQGSLRAIVADAAAKLLDSPEFIALANSINVDMAKLVAKGDVKIVASMVYNRVVAFATLTDVLGMFSNAADAMGLWAAGMLPESLVQTACSALYALSHDDAELYDHTFLTTATAIDPDYPQSDTNGASGCTPADAAEGAVAGAAAGIGTHAGVSDVAA